MLILKRHRNETIVITLGDQRAIITVIDVVGDAVRLGCTAPPEIIIHRGEIQALVDEEAERAK